MRQWADFSSKKSESMRAGEMNVVNHSANTIDVCGMIWLRSWLGVFRR
jgi:hypothetical protein